MKRGDRIYFLCGLASTRIEIVPALYLKPCQNEKYCYAEYVDPRGGYVTFSAGLYSPTFEGAKALAVVEIDSLHARSLP